MASVFQAGHEAERQVWTKGMVSGHGQQRVVLPVTKRIQVIGHVDVWEPAGITEIKSQSEAEWRPIRDSPLWERYAYQISVYMHATDLPCTILRVLRDSDGNISRSQREVFGIPPKTMGEIRGRIIEAELLARKDLTEVDCEKSFPCPYFYTHVNGEDLREQIDDPAALILAKSYVEARQQKMAADGRIKVARLALIDWMGDKKKVELPEGWKLSKFTVKGGHVEFDRTEYESLRVTEPKENDASTTDETP
jgi:hypothetical protein